MCTAAGWTDLRWEPRPLRLSVGGGAGPADAAAGSLEFGPTRIVLDGLDEPLRRTVCDAVARAFEEHVDDGEVMLLATPVIVSARTARHLRFRHDGNAAVPMVPASAPGEGRSGTAAGVLLPALPPVGLGRPPPGR